MVQILDTSSEAPKDSNNMEVDMMIKEDAQNIYDLQLEGERKTDVIGDYL